MDFSNDERFEYRGFTAHKFQYDQCECIIVEPQNPTELKRWLWKAEFFEAFPEFELEMLRRGYYLAFVRVGNTFGCPDAMRHFNAFYRFLTQEHCFYPKPILLGLSRGGLYIYNYAESYPDHVGCLYADNPVCDFKSWPGGKGHAPGSMEDWRKLLADYHFKSESEAMSYPSPIDRVEILIKAGIPLVHAAATEDEVVPIGENTDVMEKKVKALGGAIKVFRHPGKHHPHGLSDPKVVADWVENHALQC
ncbi:MAG: hypothetical protein LBM70_00450 [Victivallales bacterium]|jgi:pimeloyl-ACP methyl ester carboxylesterase|nr:hypothetical protein [Victivallales bacterium]